MAFAVHALDSSSVVSININLPLVDVVTSDEKGSFRIILLEKI